jgi:hypothetical protein
VLFRSRVDNSLVHFGSLKKGLAEDGDRNLRCVAYLCRVINS